MVVAGEEPLLLFFPVEGRTVVLEKRIDAVGIAVEGRIATVEGNAAAGRVDAKKVVQYCHGPRLAQTDGLRKGLPHSPCATPSRRGSALPARPSAVISMACRPEFISPIFTS